MKTIAFFNAKGGVGSTMLAGCSTIFATEAGVDVVGASLDPRRDLRRWIQRRVGLQLPEAALDLAALRQHSAHRHEQQEARDHRADAGPDPAPVRR